MQFIIDFYASVADVMVKLYASDGSFVKSSDLMIWIFLSILFMSIVVYATGVVLVCIVNALTVKRIFKIILFDGIGQVIILSQALIIVLSMLVFSKIPTFAQNRYYNQKDMSYQNRAIYENKSGVNFTYSFDVPEEASNIFTRSSDWVSTNDEDSVDLSSINRLKSKDQFGELEVSKGSTKSVYYAGTKKSSIKIIETAEAKKHRQYVKYKISKITVVKSGKITHSYLHVTDTKDYKEIEIEFTAYIPKEVKKELKEKSEQTEAIEKVMGNKEN